MKGQTQLNDFKSYLLCLFVVSSSPSSLLAKWDATLCGGKLLLEVPERVDFTHNELVLICGAQDVREWDDVSEAQSLYHLKIFLEERGYFKVSTTKDGKSVVARVEDKLSVNSWKIGGDSSIISGSFRQVLGEPLTPSLLDSVDERVTKALENDGYGCPKVNTEANAVTGIVSTEIQAGNRKTINKVNRESISGMNPEVLKRYEAFRIGDLFRRDNLLLTENRIASENLLQSVFFEVSCEKESVQLKQNSVAGPPRLFVVGAGINTERGPSGRISWRHLRLGRRASSLTFALSASLKEQRFDSTANWYVSDSLSRLHVNPSMSVSHESENTYERYEGKLGLTPTTSWDNDYLGIRANVGPTLNVEHVVSGLGPKNSQFMTLFGAVRVMDHSYELNQTAPKEGFYTELRTNTAIRDLFSSVGASKVEILLTKLWNVKQWDPPALIFGLRMLLATTFTDEDLQLSQRLPSQFRLFLGGSENLRGFGRLTLPGPEGALSAVALSGEVRFASVLPWGLHPFVFTDIGKVGAKTLQFSPLTYLSPGIGLRWQSPIGALRTTMARGITHHPEFPSSHQWNFYFSLGEEF